MLVSFPPNCFETVTCVGSLLDPSDDQVQTSIFHQIHHHAQFLFICSALHILTDFPLQPNIMHSLNSVVTEDFGKLFAHSWNSSPPCVMPSSRSLSTHGWQLPVKFFRCFFFFKFGRAVFDLLAIMVWCTQPHSGSLHPTS